MRTATMKKKVEEPRITCPVCGDTEKESSYEKDHGMCSRCWWFLSPEAGGRDHGLFMIRVRTLDIHGRRTAEIRPRGFWSGTIEVRERRDHEYNSDTKEIDLNWRVEVSWGSGGTDGTVDEIQTAENFTRAMDHAVMIAKIWKVERQNENATRETLDRIVRNTTAFKSFDDLLNAAGDYRPTIQVNDSDGKTLADHYDATQAQRGDLRRAYRRP